MMKNKSSRSINTGSIALYMLAGVFIAALLFGLFFLLVKWRDDRSLFTPPVQEIPSPTPTLTPTLGTQTVTPVFAPTFTPAPPVSITGTPPAPEGEPFSIGMSVEGKSLEVYRFGSGPVARMIIGAIHGGYESNTATLVYLLRDDIRNGTIQVPADVTLYLLPVINPDGFMII